MYASKAYLAEPGKESLAFAEDSEHRPIIASYLKAWEHLFWNRHRLTREH
jgi:hypothetical protein